MVTSNTMASSSAHNHLCGLDASSATNMEGDYIARSIMINAFVRNAT